MWHHGLAYGAVLVRIENAAQMDRTQALRFFAGNIFVQWLEDDFTTVHEIEERLDEC